MAASTPDNRTPSSVRNSIVDLDPFDLTPTSSASSSRRGMHRYSSFDTKLFSSYTRSSPTQAKRALEAHIADTDRRIQDASKLGTTLLEQKMELLEGLKNVEQQQTSNEVGPELKQKLVELEREYNEVGRETARQFIPKNRRPSNGFADGQGEISSLYADARPTPSKLASVSSRKLRNAPTSRIHDIEFATEISTSLLAQVRELQSVLADKEEELRRANSDRSKLQADAETFALRLRGMDENEQRYKDDTWHLETQLQELVTEVREASAREQRLTQSLNSIRAEKTTADREYDDLQLSHNKLSDDHEILRRQHDGEVSGMQRTLAAIDAERTTLQKKLEEMTAQNEELAKAFTYRNRAETDLGDRDTMLDDNSMVLEPTTPDHSPPASPTKATPRLGVLESETLKSSLHHAHRMIQNLKNNIHREKTEKLDLKRMLQDARDELEARKAEGGGAAANAGRKRKPGPSDIFKKPARPDRLGGARGVHEEVINDPSWEEYEDSPSKSRVAGQRDLYDLSTDASDAFETANERDSVATETDGFQTGLESMAGESADELTETEESHGMRSREAALARLNGRRRRSIESSASDDGDMFDLSTPPAESQARHNMKPYRRFLRVGESANAQDSPASFTSDASDGRLHQDLAAELEGVGDDSSVAEGTPARTIESIGASPQLRSRDVTPVPASTKPIMVDSGMLTDPWDPKGGSYGDSAAGDAPVAGAIETGAARGLPTPTTPVNDSIERPNLSSEPSRSGTEDLNLSPALSAPWSQPAPISEPYNYYATRVVPLQMSSISSLHTEPIAPTAVSLQQPTLGEEAHQGLIPRLAAIPLQMMSSISAFNTASVADTPAQLPQSPPIREFDKDARPRVVPLQMSSISTQHVRPIAPTAILQPAPVQETLRNLVPRNVPLQMSSIFAQHMEPIAPVHTPALQPAPVVETFRDSNSRFTVSQKSSFSNKPVQPTASGMPVSNPPYPITSSIPDALSEFEPTASECRPNQGSDVVTLDTLSATSGAMPTEFRQPSDRLSGPTPAVEQKSIPQDLAVLASSMAFVDDLIKHHPPRTERLTPVDRFVSGPSDSMSISSSSIPVPSSAVPLSPGSIPLPVKDSMTSRTTKANTGAGPSGPALNKPGNAFSLPKLWPSPMPNSQDFNVSIIPEPQLQLARTESEDGHFEEPTLQIAPAPEEMIRPPFRPVSGNNASTGSKAPAVRFGPNPPARPAMISEGTQTVVSAATVSPLASGFFGGPSKSPASKAPGRDRALSTPTRQVAEPGPPTEMDTSRLGKRPVSASPYGQGAPSTPPVPGFPPLPTGHREVIAAASRNSSGVNITGPPPGSNMGPPPGSNMGPPPGSNMGSPPGTYIGLPLANNTGAPPLNNTQPQMPPPSAWRPSSQSRPRTPGGTVSQSPSKVPTTPRARGTSIAGRSEGTRRSSVSSFASEFDDRHSVNAASLRHNGEGFEMSANTDPRMIQAITQTMIGEFLWKYTRKAGRGEHSNNRHRRFFWIHPYTRTLYWSSQDPSQGGRAELKAKSVAIEAVRVVSDENPIPPGLHPKSIIVVTPGRSIKFTAPTNQRHETWFNALSYLLLRNTSEPHDEATPQQDHQHYVANSYSSNPGHERTNTADSINSDDVAEFAPGLYSRSGTRSTAASRRSASATSNSAGTGRGLVSSLTQRTTSPTSQQSQWPTMAVRQSQAAQKRVDNPAHSYPSVTRGGISNITEAQGVSNPMRAMPDGQPGPVVEAANDGADDGFKQPTRPASAASRTSGRMSSMAGSFRPMSLFGRGRSKSRSAGGAAASDGTMEPVPPLPSGHAGGGGGAAETPTVENVRACCDGEAFPESLRLS